jgi:hypothetical protein
MFNLTHHPTFLFAISFIVMWLSAQFGRRFINWRTNQEKMQEEFSLIVAASLTLLGLIIGFSFSMAISRYDQRKNYEEAEANAIGTEYLRADLLPAAEAAKVRTLLKEYLDQRILFYTITDDQERQEQQQMDTRTNQLQTELWSTVVPVATAQPTPIVALAVAGMNDVLNSQGYTQSAWWNRIPGAAWALMAAIAIGCNVLIGHGSRAAPEGSKLLFILPLVISIAFLLIADIDAPRRGIIRVNPQNLNSLAQTLQ